MSKVKVNGEFFSWEEGMTVSSLLRQMNYPYTPLTIRVNGKVVSAEAGDTPVPPESEVQIIRIISGG